MGSGDSGVLVAGTNFVSASVVRMNGAPLQTSFISGVQLSAIIPASQLAATGTFQVAVLSPAPGGGVSNALTLTVREPGTAPNPESRAGR